VQFYNKFHLVNKLAISICKVILGGTICVNPILGGTRVPKGWEPLDYTIPYDISFCRHIYHFIILKDKSSFETTLVSDRISHTQTIWFPRPLHLVPERFYDIDHNVQPTDVKNHFSGSISFSTFMTKRKKF